MASLLWQKSLKAIVYATELTSCTPGRVPKSVVMDDQVLINMRIDPGSLGGIHFLYRGLWVVSITRRFFQQSSKRYKSASDNDDDSTDDVVSKVVVVVVSFSSEVMLISLVL